MSAMISTKALRVDYADLTAVLDLDLAVEAGQIYGLVGPNGAGKTSTIKAIAGIVESTYGEIRVAGFDMELAPEDGWRHLGYMPDFSPVYENLTVGEYLELFAAAHLIPRRERKARTRRWASRIQLEEKWDTYIRELSRGMRQRLVLAKTLLHEPKVLLLDEPASGMDPIARIELRELLKETAANGAAVLISSHILTELSDLCNAIGVMERGRMVVSGTVDEIRDRLGSKGRLCIRISGANSAIREQVRAILLEDTRSVHGLDETPSGEWRADFLGSDADAATLLAGLVSAGIPVADFHVEKEDIEDLFMKIGARETS